VPGRLRGGRPAAVLPVKTGFEDRLQRAGGDTGVPAQGTLGDDRVMTERYGTAVTAREGRTVTTGAGGELSARDGEGIASGSGPGSREARADARTGTSTHGRCRRRHCRCCRDDALRRARDLPGEIPYEIVRRVPPVRGLLQEGDIDEAVERGLGATFVGAGEAGDEGGSVGGQVERADTAQGERRVPVGLALRSSYSRWCNRPSVAAS
jgi:hypothetical protein